MRAGSPPTPLSVARFREVFLTSDVDALTVIAAFNRRFPTFKGIGELTDEQRGRLWWEVTRERLSA